LRRGRFISLEGGEAGGKSTQARLLVAALGRAGIAAVATREPGGSPGAEAIRGFVKGAVGVAWSPRTEALLHYAARQDHLDRLIRPALAAGRWVVTDRFADSTRAYQGAGQGADAAWLAALDRLVVGADAPDLTLVLDVDRATAAARQAGRDGPAGQAADRYEGQDAAFHQRVREAFLAIAAAAPARCRIIDAARPVALVEADIWRAVAERFALPAAPG
jgi:dTMP kinase